MNIKPESGSPLTDLPEKKVRSILQNESGDISEAVSKNIFPAPTYNFNGAFAERILLLTYSLLLSVGIIIFRNPEVGKTPVYDIFWAIYV